MVRRFKRRSRVTWLPNIGQTAETDENLGIIYGAISCSAAGTITTVTHPLVKDEQPEQTTESLAEWTQGGYLLKRIVGKFFCGMHQKAPEEGAFTPGFAVLSAGLEVLRCSSDNNPMGAAAPEQNYATILEGNETDPWIWRRDWILANGNANDTSTAAEAWEWAPYTNAEYGSVMDGPHVDVKVGRRIGPEERLFLSLTTFPRNGFATAAVQEDGNIEYMFIYRVLGVPIRSTNRRNASR